MKALNCLGKLGLIVLFMNMYSASAQTIQKQNIDIFPKVEEGYEQFVIEVPHSDKDHEKKIELIIGKVIEVDNCNKHSLSGSLEEKNLEGWGYTYYTFESNGDVLSTMMACPDSEKVHKFIASKSELIRYNGKLPVVVYVPEGFEVRYKIWKAEDEEFKALKTK